MAATRRLGDLPRPQAPALVAAMKVRVYGIPAPQGSKKGFVRGGRVHLVESSAKVSPWRQDVVHAALAVKGHSPTPALDGPVRLTIVFYLPKPKSARKDAQATKRPDLDKLVRSTCDALTTAAVYGDDAQVVELVARKVYSDDTNPAGAVIAIEAA